METLTKRSEHLAWCKERATVAGSIAGTPHGEGYVLIGIYGEQYLAHRLAFLYMTGAWPKGKLDHRDRVRNNNVWGNLRPATNSQNGINSTRKPRNLPRGVFFHHGKYEARTTRRDQEQRNVTIGRFASPEEAHQAWRNYMAAAHGPEFLP